MTFVDARNYLAPGVPVEVRSRFNDEWIGGFMVDDVEPGTKARSVRLRRVADGSALPATFPSTQVRPAPDREEVSDGLSPRDPSSRSIAQVLEEQSVELDDTVPVRDRLEIELLVILLAVEELLRLLDQIRCLSASASPA